MNLQDKIVGLALAALISLVGWNLHETWAIGKQKILISTSMELRRPKMIKKWWKKLVDWFWKDFHGRS